MGYGARWVVVVGAAVAVLVGCSAPATPPSGGPETAAGPAATRSVTHALGTTQVPDQPRRIVSAGVTMTGPLLGLDAPVVATATAPPGGGTADGNGFFAAWAGRATARGTVPLGGPTVDVEAVVAQRPDVIVGSAVGADAVDRSAYAQLSAIAPTIVLDHSTVSWQELSDRLGAALGREEQAAAVAAEFEARAAALRPRLDTEREAVALTVTADGYNVFTPESAQGALLTDLGLRLRAVQPSGQGGGTRRDIVRVARERAGDLGDASLFVVNADDAAVEGYRAAQPVLAALPAFADGRVYALGPESFRLDRFSASAVLDRLQTRLR